MDLRSGAAYWTTQSGLLEVYPPLTNDEQADVLVIGGGISGALIADRLIHEGMNVVVLDRRDVARGSTSASTALLQYEIDTHLTDLAQMVGWEHARRAYRLCLEAIGKVGVLAAEVGEGGQFQTRQSLYFASSGRDVKALEAEYRARRDMGIELEFLKECDVQAQFGFRRKAALLSSTAAQVNPYRLAHALLRWAAAGGARVYDRTEVGDVKQRGDGFEVQTSRGFCVQAQWVIVASGYESARFLPRPLAQLKNSYALVTEPVADLPPSLGSTLMWETARPYLYLYLRTTTDGRVIVGGEDENHTTLPHREQRIARKQARLEKKLRELYPHTPFETAYAWAGTFGETKDGLAYIGPHPQRPEKLLFALGYGGNGITYSQLASELLTDRILGKPTPDLEVFRLDR